MQALLDTDEIYDVYEIHKLQPDQAKDDVTTFKTATLIHPEIDALLDRYQELFAEPISLPPHRIIDHRIHLFPDTKPVNVRPYRYPHYQKTEMEKLVKEMLDQGIIRFSHNPFSSPVLLVKKKDGNYHFYVNYWALNAVAVKDKFSIPTSNKMFEELGGAIVFTKLDLQAGYHQIRFHDQDIYKTAFRTHDRHYEFLEYQFYVKRSKCVFEAASLDYLGHIISGQGVEMDPKKVEAVTTWPVPKTQKQVIQTPVQQQYVRMHSEDDLEAGAFMSLSRHNSGLLESLKEEHRTLDEDRYYVGLHSKLKLPLLNEFHETQSARHCGTKKMMVGLSVIFYWKGMRKMVDDFVRTCLVCQQTKYSTEAPGGLLQPLPIPEAVWEEVSIDFITGLPMSKGLTVIFVVVDRLTKYAYFGALPISYNAHRVAELFMDIVVKHHGFPKAVVSNRDAIFVSQFWSSLFKLSGTQLKYSTAYHPQTDGYHSSIRMSTYQALYGKLPPSLITYPPEKSKLAALDDMLVERDMLIRHLKDNLAVARNRMETNTNQKRREVEFSVGDKVLVKLRPYRQVSVAKRPSNKLSKHFYRPFEVSERVGKVAYREVEARGVHALPVDFEEGSLIEQPLSICGVRSVLSRGKPTTQVVVLFEEEENDTQPPVVCCSKMATRFRDG
ncbi:transposon ty3-I gag-pol polyprotein [Tanacetum coccineum]|uniref:Transposon ty3-I gag-pol polyprotein n=1 Tax=Tanacetum coccineum TaxID=301880 RepID=A0ABQ5CBF6_9ASTR